MRHLGVIDGPMHRADGAKMIPTSFMDISSIISSEFEQSFSYDDCPLYFAFCELLIIFYCGVNIVLVDFHEPF